MKYLLFALTITALFACDAEIPNPKKLGYQGIPTIETQVNENGDSVKVEIPFVVPEFKFLNQDSNYVTNKDFEGKIVDDAWKEHRKKLLLSAFRKTKPDVLLIEMFPFGRRQMRFELDPLIALAKSMGIPVISSIRDILTTHKTPGKSEWIIDRVQKDIDHVLVHGDPDFIPLEDSFPLAAQVKEKIVYTGYVVEHNAQNRNPNSPEDRKGVLVSAGGGAAAGAGPCASVQEPAEFRQRRHGRCHH